MVLSAFLARTVQIADVAEKLEQAESSLGHGARLGRCGAMGAAAAERQGGSAWLRLRARVNSQCPYRCVPTNGGRSVLVTSLLVGSHDDLTTGLSIAVFNSPCSLRRRRRYFEKKKPATSSSGAAGGSASGGGGGDDSALARICRDTSKLAAEQIKGLSTQVSQGEGG
jgi:hypothetical protein